jgi:hypothetical protein
MNFVSVIVSATIFAGCQFSGAESGNSGDDTGDVEVDFIVDSAQARFEKLKPLTQYSDEECVKKMAEAAKRFMSNPTAQGHLSAEAQKGFETLKSRPQDYEQVANRIAKAHCSLLSVLTDPLSVAHSESLDLDAAVDFMDEDFIMQKQWPDEIAKEKYSAMADLKKEECHGRISDAIEKLLKSPALQADLMEGRDQPKEKIEALKKVGSAQRKRQVEELVRWGCSQLASFKYGYL